MNPKNLYALAFVMLTQSACVALSTADPGWSWHRDQAACFDLGISCVRGY